MQAARLSTATVERLDTFNRRTLDGLASRVYFYYAWSHECLDQLAGIQRRAPCTCIAPAVPVSR